MVCVEKREEALFKKFCCWATLGQNSFSRLGKETHAQVRCVIYVELKFFKNSVKTFESVFAQATLFVRQSSQPPSSISSTSVFL